MKIIPVIMAGGSGTRFWPRSRKKAPKQLLKIAHPDRTMIQSAVKLLEGKIADDNILIVTNIDQAKDIKTQNPQIPSENIICEPCGRDTAPCVGLSAIYAQAKDPNAIMLVMPSDHIIEPAEKYHLALDAAVNLVESEDCIATFGIPPHFPSTGYGYIEKGDPVSCAIDLPSFQVKQFTEKPNQEKAIEFLETKNYFWNAGIFVWKASYILSLFEKFMPEVYAGLLKIKESIGTDKEQQTIQEVYPTLTRISIDFGIMEKAPNVKVVEVSYDWDDVGSWSSIENHFDKDKNKNLVQGQVVDIDSKNSILINDDSNRLLATIGLEEMLVVQSGEATLITKKSKDQDVKKIIDLLKEKKLDQYL